MWEVWKKKQNVKERDYRAQLEKSILIDAISYHLKNDYYIYLYIYIMTVLLWKVFQELWIASSATQRNNCLIIWFSEFSVVVCDGLESDFPKHNELNWFLKK